MVERFRALATLYDKDPENFLASITLAPLRVCLRTLWVRDLVRLRGRPESLRVDNGAEFAGAFSTSEPT